MQGSSGGPGADEGAGGLIDCDVHNAVPRVEALFPYLPPHWVEHVRQSVFKGAGASYYPKNAPVTARPGSVPPDGPAGSSLALLREQVLDPLGVEVAILNCLYAIDSLHKPEAAVAFARAVNDWQIAEWLDPEPRLRASIILPFEHADLAVAEIERRARDPRFVQVQFSGRPREPMGRRKYWPIYAACVEHGLAVMSHAFGSGGQPITGCGWPSYYIEDHVGPAQSMQANLISLVVEGVFERFPELRFVSAENGFGWAPSLGWRLDNTYELLRGEVPHLRRRPSEYLREHVWFCTQPIEEPDKPAYFLRLVEQIGAERLIFASDYAHWDWDAPDTALPARLPDDVRRKIFYENARDLYRLPDRAD